MEVGRIPVRSVRCYRFGQEQIKKSIGILGLFAFHKYMWDAGYTVSHLKWSFSIYTGSSFVTFGVGELMEACGATAESRASFRKNAIKVRWISRLAVMLYAGGLSFPRAFLLPLYEGLGTVCGRFVSYPLIDLGKAALFKKGEEIEWAWETGIPAYLAGFERHNPQFTLPMNEKAFRTPAPELDISPPKVDGSEVAYLNQQIGNGTDYKEWKEGGIAYWNKVIETVSSDADLRAARKEKVKRSIETISSDEELRGLFVRLADESLNPARPLERRQALVAGVFIALETCKTAWAAVFERLYRDVMSEGKGVEWKVRDGNSQLKEAVVVDFGRFKEIYDQQHHLVAWRRGFGAETGMANPLAVRVEGGFGNDFLHSLLPTVFTPSTNTLQKKRDYWIPLFRERYTPELMVAHWKSRLNSGSEGSFVQEVNQFIFETVGIPQSEWDGKGLYDTEKGHFTDKGVCLILAAVGELTPDDKIRELAPDYFAQLGG